MFPDPKLYYTDGHDFDIVDLPGKHFYSKYSKYVPNFFDLIPIASYFT